MLRFIRKACPKLSRFDRELLGRMSARVISRRFSRHGRNRSALSATFCRNSSIVGFHSGKQDAVAENLDRCTLKLPTSQHRFDALNAAAKDALVARGNGSIAATLGAWFAGAGTLALLLLAVPSKDDDGGLLDETPILSTAVSDFWDSAVDIGKRVASMFEGLLDASTIVLTKAVQTAISLIVLLQCLSAILSKGEDYTNDLALRWRLRVLSLLADLSGASHSRRRALLEAGNGAVADWLLEAVGHGEPEYRLIQVEAARAIAHIMWDAETCEELLARPNAMSHLLRFTASIQPNNKTELQMFQEGKPRSRGRSMLVTAMMDIITSSCETSDKGGIVPKLSGSADANDIAAALKVMKEGGLYPDESQDDDENSGQDKGGVHEIGMRVLGGTGVVEVQNSQNFLSLSRLARTFLPDWSMLATCWSSRQYWHTLPLSEVHFVATGISNAGKSMKLKENRGTDGLWDDLQGRHVAVPLAAWAVATWAQASRANCAKIAELDKDGEAVMAAVIAPERSVKWHGAIAAQCLVEIGSDEPAVTWSSALLKTALQASNVEDTQLARVALSSLYSCLRRSANARKVVSEKSLSLMRELAKETSKDINLQKLLAQALEVLSFSGAGWSLQEGKKWSSILLYWVCNNSLEGIARSAAARVLAHLLDGLGQAGIPLSQAWLAMLLSEAMNGARVDSAKGDVASSKANTKGLVQNHANQIATQAAAELTKVIWLSLGDGQSTSQGRMATNASDSPWGDLLDLDTFQNLARGARKDPKAKLTAAGATVATLKALKALTEVSAEDKTRQVKIIEAGGLQLLKKFMLSDDYDKWLALETSEALKSMESLEHNKVSNTQQTEAEAMHLKKSTLPTATHLRKHAARLLSILSLQSAASFLIKQDETLCKWLEDCADNRVPSCNDLKTLSYARVTLLNIEAFQSSSLPDLQINGQLPRPHYEDKVFLLNTESSHWKQSPGQEGSFKCSDMVYSAKSDTSSTVANTSEVLEQETSKHCNDFGMDVVFVHGLCGGPFKTWRIAEDIAPRTGPAGLDRLVEKVDVDSGREGTCWPKQWLASDLPACRLLTLKYKTNLSQWSGATLPLQEVSAMLLDKLIGAGVGDRPVVFVTHSMGGLVVKQMLMQAAHDTSRSHLVKKTFGIVFYSCPHFGSKLADMPWRFGLVFRPAPSIGQLRSGSTRLEELNQFIRTLHKGGLQVLSFSETKVTPLVEGYGGWALRMEVVPIESAYPGFGDLVVLDGTDHVNSCKPLSQDDEAYTQTLKFLQNIAKSV